jgi:hypothetical protein
MVCENSEERIAQSPTEQDYGEVFAHAIVRSTCGGEEHAGRKKWNDCGNNQSHGVPPLKQSQDDWHSTATEFTVQIYKTCPTCQPEGDVRSNKGTRCRDDRELVPWAAMTRGEDSDQYVGASEYWQRQAVQNAKEEQSEPA